MNMLESNSEMIWTPWSQTLRWHGHNAVRLLDVMDTMEQSLRCYEHMMLNFLAVMDWIPRSQTQRCHGHPGVKL